MLQRYINGNITKVEINLIQITCVARQIQPTSPQDNGSHTVVSVHWKEDLRAIIGTIGECVASYVKVIGFCHRGLEILLIFNEFTGK